MKMILRFTVVALLLVSCKDSNESKILDGILNEATGKNEDINEKYDLLLKDLSEKTPLTDEQLMEAFPKKLGNLNLDESGNNNIEPEINRGKMVAGDFGNGVVALEILDAAGENATGAIIQLKMLQLNTVTSENDNTIRHSKQERNGFLTFGTDRDEDTNSDYQSEIRFLYDDRFYVTLQGKGMNIDKLWQKLNVDDLKKFKEFNH